MIRVDIFKCLLQKLKAGTGPRQRSLHAPRGSRGLRVALGSAAEVVAEKRAGVAVG